MIKYINKCIFTDAPRAWGMFFQDTASPQMEPLLELRNHIMFWLALILTGVAWILFTLVTKYVYKKFLISNKFVNHGTLIELVWTIMPGLILIVFHYFNWLFFNDDSTDPSMSILIEGEDWDWSYQYPDFINNDDECIEYDSYLIPETDLEEGGLKMLVTGDDFYEVYKWIDPKKSSVLLMDNSNYPGESANPQQGESSNSEIESSNESLDVPDLVRSRGAGELDSSTVPDTVSDSDDNISNRDLAEFNFTTRQQLSVAYVIQDEEELNCENITNKYQDKFNELSKEEAMSLYEEKSSELKQDYQRVQEEIREAHINRRDYINHIDSPEHIPMHPAMREQAEKAIQESYKNHTKDNDEVYLLQKAALDEAAQYCIHNILKSDSDSEVGEDIEEN